MSYSISLSSCPAEVPGIHALSGRTSKTWMAGTSPAMTLVLVKGVK